MDKLGRLRRVCAGKLIWISIDETTDVRDRYVANVIVGILDPDFDYDPYILDTVFLSQTNNTTISQTVVNSLTLLFPQGIPYDSVLGFITDGAAYMKKAYKDTLRNIFPKMIHIVCVMHGLHNVADKVRLNFPVVDKFILHAKKLFRKSPKNRQYFKNYAPALKPPPRPVITRWGTWLEAVYYYTENLEVFREMLPSLKESGITDSSALEVLCEILEENFSQLEGQLCCITSNYKILSRSIKILQSRMSLEESIRHLTELQQNLVHEIGKQKLSQILKKNTGLTEIIQVARKLESGTPIPVDYRVSTWNAKDCLAAKKMPLESCDVERSFSKYADVLSDTRHSLTETSLKMILFCYSNKSL